MLTSVAHAPAHGAAHTFASSLLPGSGEIVFSRSVACGGHSSGMPADAVCLLPDEESHVRSL